MVGRCSIDTQNPTLPYFGWWHVLALTQQHKCSWSHKTFVGMWLCSGVPTTFLKRKVIHVKKAASVWGTHFFPRKENIWQWTVLLLIFTIRIIYWFRSCISPPNDQAKNLVDAFAQKMIHFDKRYLVWWLCTVCLLLLFSFREVISSGQAVFLMCAVKITWADLSRNLLPSW